MESEVRAGAVVVAAGAGSRFGGTEAPKQFLPLAGRPLAVRAVEALLGHPAIERVVLVLPASGFENWREQVAPFLSGAGSRILFRPGGTTRQESATLGLEALDEARAQADAGASLQPPDLVLVHDGARPAVPASLVARVIEAARSHGAAIPAVPPLDTLWRLDSDGCADRLVDRERTAAAQTPQCFRRDILRDALSRAAAAGFVGTDEASAVRWAGHPVRIVSGSRRNLKITEPADLELIRGLFGRIRGRRGSGSGSTPTGSERRARFAWRASALRESRRSRVIRTAMRCSTHLPTPFWGRSPRPISVLSFPPRTRRFAGPRAAASSSALSKSPPAPDIGRARWTAP